MLDFIEFKAGQKQPMATYPFTFCNLSERAVRGKDELPGRARKSAYVVSVVDLFSRRNQTGTRIFSPRAVSGLCIAIGRYWYLFKRLTAVSAGRFYRFEHIVAYSSGKVVAKSVNPPDPKPSQTDH